MVKTRTKQVKKPTASQSISSRVQTLDDSVKEPPHLFVLPKDLSNEARIVSIPDLTNVAKASKLLVCPDKGFYEFTNVAETRACRSWLLTPGEHSADHVEASDGYVLQQPDLLLATPIDPVFVVLALMLASTETMEAYLSCSDYIFAADIVGWSQLQHLLRQIKFTDLLKQLEARMTTISDELSLGDETLYRLSHSKICKVLLNKAARLAERGFAKSIEQHFVQEALDIPTPLVERSEMVEAGAPGISQDTVSSQSVFQDSSITEVSAESVSTAPTSITEPSATTVSADVARLLRIRTAWEYMLRSYVTNSEHKNLRGLLQAQKVLDFKPLHAHEERAAAMKQEVQALRTLSDNISRKRPVEDDEANAKQEEKRRKKEEEEQRKKSMSQGVKKLMKADTSGMKKLSSFFTKKMAK